MSSTKKLVLNTRILDIKTLLGPDNREIREIHIPYPDFQFRPGQFVMIKVDKGPTCWAYPYMIQRKTEQGFVVYSVDKTSLFLAKPELPLVVWGANGRPVDRNTPTVVLCEAATWFLAAPVFTHQADCQTILLNPSGLDGCLDSCKDLTSVRSLSQMSQLLLPLLNYRIVAALNIHNLLSLVKETPQIDTQNLHFFSSTKISCGVDGCKSCYLHNKDLPLGISVCCNGPFLPFSKVDFEVNQRCFYTFD